MEKKIKVEITRKDLITLIIKHIPNSKWIRKYYKEFNMLKSIAFDDRWLWSSTKLKEELDDFQLYQLYYILTERDFDANEKIN